MKTYEGCFPPNESFKGYLLGLMPVILLISVAVPLCAFLALRAVEVYEEDSRTPWRAQVYSVQLKVVER